MTEKSLIQDTERSDVKKIHEQAANKLRNNITRFNALTSFSAGGDSFDVIEAEKDSIAWLEALNAEGGLQEMLAAQMLSIHQLQQISISMANKTLHRNNPYFSNTAIKLANVFVQQAALLAKLQGAGGQKIIVEHVEVHHGGQAVVGNITGGAPISEEKK